MNKKQKKMLTRIIIAAVLMIAFKVINTFVDIPTVVLFYNVHDSLSCYRI